MTTREKSLLLTYATFMTCTVDMTTKIVWTISSGATRGTRLRCTGNLEVVLLSLHMDFLARSINAYNPTWNALLRGECLAVFTAFAFVGLSYCRRLNTTFL